MTPRSLLLVAAFVALSAPASTASGAAGQVEQLLVEVAALRAAQVRALGALTGLELEAAALADQGSAAAFEVMLDRGLARLQRGQVEAAAVSLMAAVGLSGAAFSPRYDEALFTLGETLWSLDNLTGAASFYQRLLERRTLLYASDAIERLLAIAERRGDHTDVDAYYRQYVALAGDSVRPRTAYLRGKQLLAAERFGDAERMLARVPLCDRDGLRAGYLRGVAILQRGGPSAMDDALRAFAQVTQQPTRTPEDVKVSELSWLAQGRLRYELGQLEASVDAYLRIPHTSPHFSDMLWEVTWTHIKRAQRAEDLDARERAYGKAVEVLQLLEVVAAGTRLDPELRVVRAYVELERGEPERAERGFQEVVRRYRPAQQDLERLLALGMTRERYLQELRARAGDMQGTELLPGRFLEWFRAPESIDRGVDLYRGTRRLEQELAHANRLRQQLAQTLQARVAEDPSAGPGVGALYRRVHDLGADVVALRQRGATLQQRILADETLRGCLSQAPSDRSAEPAMGLAGGSGGDLPCTGPAAVALQVLPQLRQLDAELALAEPRTAELARQLERAHASQIEAARQLLIVEQGQLEADQRALEDARDEAAALVADHTVDAVRELREEFYGFVLRGEVGVIDVAWRRKRQTTDALTRTLLRRKADLTALAQEFVGEADDLEAR